MPAIVSETAPFLNILRRDISPYLIILPIITTGWGICLGSLNIKSKIKAIIIINPIFIKTRLAPYVL